MSVNTNISYIIHFEPGANHTPIEGTGPRIDGILFTDSNANILWNDPTNNTIKNVWYIEFTYNRDAMDDIVIRMLCTTTTCISGLEYFNETLHPDAKQGGMKWKNDGTNLSITIHPPDYPSDLPPSCEDYPWVTWHDTTGAPPKRLLVRIKRQKDPTASCLWSPPQY